MRAWIAVVGVVVLLLLLLAANTGPQAAGIILITFSVVAFAWAVVGLIKPAWARLPDLPCPYWLLIRNDGMALARNVRVLFDGKPIIEHTLVSDSDGEEEITTIGAGTEHRYILAVSLQSARILDVLIQWHDDSGEPRPWESKLQIV